MKELLKKNSLEELESEYDDSTDFVKRQVIFCARWSLDNLCEFFCCLCQENVHFILSFIFFFVNNNIQLSTVDYFLLPRFWVCSCY